MSEKDGASGCACCGNGVSSPDILEELWPGGRGGAVCDAGEGGTVTIIATLHTVDFRGDHAEEVEIPFAVGEDESVKALCARLFANLSSYQREGSAFITLRQVLPVPADGR